MSGSPLYLIITLFIQGIQDYEKPYLEQIVDFEAIPPCETKWDQWEPWEQCSVTCGGSTRERKRKCSERQENCECDRLDNCVCEPDKDGKLETDSEECEFKPCHEQKQCDGGWSSWKEWGSCDISCGEGKGRKGKEIVIVKPNTNSCQL